MSKNRRGLGGLKYNRPKPPTKVYHKKRDVIYRGYTEVHRALITGGRDNRTGRLSNREFNRQLAQEISYNVREAGAILDAAFSPFFAGLKALAGSLIKSVL